MLMMVAAQLVVMPANDAVVKLLAAQLPLVQLAWARFFGNIVLLLPLALGRHGLTGWHVARPGLQLLRGLLIIASNLFFIAAVRAIPLADAIAIVFAAPLIVAALSPRLLGESADWRRWAAVLIGLTGALIIVRPGGGGTDWHHFLPLLSAICYALYLLTTRKLAGTAPALLTQTLTAAIAAIVATAMLPFVWVTPSALQIGLMAFVGSASCLGHGLITKAHDHVTAATLAPLTYLGLLGAVFFGWAMFGQLPDLLTYTGAAIVVASGLAIWLRPR